MLNLFNDQIKPLINNIIEKKIYNLDKVYYALRHLNDEQKNIAKDYINSEKKSTEEKLESIRKTFQHSPISSTDETEIIIGHILKGGTSWRDLFFLGTEKKRADYYLSLCKDLFVINNLLLILENKPLSTTLTSA